MGKEGPLAARQPRRGVVQWEIYGQKTSHFETFQSWTPRYVSHSETFESWRAEKASHFETFRGWRAEKASHFESLGDFRLREVSHGESFGGRGLREVSHGVGRGLDGPGHGAVLAGVGVFAVVGLGHGASRAVGRGWICGRAGPLGLIVERRHEAWQGTSVTNSVPMERLLVATLSAAMGLHGVG